MKRQWRMSGKWRAGLIATAVGLLATTTSIQTARAGIRAYRLLTWQDLTLGAAAGF